MFIFKGELRTVGGPVAEFLTIFESGYGGLFIAGEIIPVGASRREFGVDTFFENFAVEEDGFIVLGPC